MRGESWKAESHDVTLSAHSPVRRSKNGSLPPTPMNATPTKPFPGCTGQLKGVALSRESPLSGHNGDVGLPLLSEEAVGGEVGGAEVSSLGTFGLEAGMGMEVGGLSSPSFTVAPAAVVMELPSTALRSSLVIVPPCARLGWTC